MSHNEPHADTHAISERLARLELDFARETARLRRSARRLKAALSIVLVSSTLVVLSAAGPVGNQASQVLRTKRIEIVDDVNRVVAALAVGDAGGQLDLWNADGTNAARLTGSQRGGDLALWGPNGRAAAGLFAVDGGGRLELYDPSGSLNGRLTASREGGAFSLLNGLGKPGVIAAATERGGGVSACDSLGRPLAELAIIEGAGQVHLFDRNATSTALLYSTPRGGALELSDSTGKKSLSAGADVGGGSLAVFSPIGTEIVAIAGTANGGGSIDVRNAAGKTVVRSFVGEDEAGRWGVGTPEGQPAIGAQGSAAGGTLALLTGGRRVIQLDANSVGGRIEAADPSGQTGVVMGIDASLTSGALSLRNERGQEVLRLSSDDKGSGILSVFSRTGTERRVYSVK